MLDITNDVKKCAAYFHSKVALGQIKFKSYQNALATRIGVYDIEPCLQYFKERQIFYRSTKGVFDRESGKSAESEWVINPIFLNFFFPSTKEYMLGNHLYNILMEWTNHIEKYDERCRIVSSMLKADELGLRVEMAKLQRLGILRENYDLNEPYSSIIKYKKYERLLSAYQNNGKTPMSLLLQEYGVIEMEHINDVVFLMNALLERFQQMMDKTEVSNIKSNVVSIYLQTKLNVVNELLMTPTNLINIDTASMANKSKLNEDLVAKSVKELMELGFIAKLTEENDFKINKDKLLDYQQKLSSF